MPELSFDTITLGLVAFAVFLFSTTCHEAAHALIAKLGGDPTASEQITLSPLPHIERSPFGMVVVPLISFLMAGWVMGWASAPYDPTWAYRHPHRAARMALAGPAANFLLMFLAAISIRVGYTMEVFRAPSTASLGRMTEAVDPTSLAGLVAIFLSVLFILNLLLGVLNLIPVPPLDGNVGITLFMSEERARSFLDLFRTEGVAFMGLLVAFVVFNRISGVVVTLGLNLLYYPHVTYGPS